MKLLILFMAVLMIQYSWADNYIEIGFNFHKSPDIGVNETAVYKCSVTHSGFGVFWYINDIPSISSKIKKLGIATEGSSTLQSNISIPGDPVLNGTVVQCQASGYLDGSYITLSEEDILLIQGLLEVNNLNCHQTKTCCFNCVWQKPSSLSDVPILGYQLIITTVHNESLMLTTTLETESYDYCPSQFGNYSVSVAGLNRVGQGTAIVILTELKSLIEFSSFQLKKQRKEIWMLQANLRKETCIGLTFITRVHLDRIDEPWNSSSEVLVDHVCSSKISKAISLTDNAEWTAKFRILYESGLEIFSRPYNFSTNHMKNISVSQIASENKLCFHCSVKPDSLSSGCHVTIQNDTWNSTITILRSCYTCSTNFNCISNENMIEGYYDATFNAIDLDGYVLDNERQTDRFLVVKDKTIPSDMHSISSNNKFFSSVAMVSPTATSVHNKIMLLTGVTGGLVGIILLFLLFFAVMIIVWIRRLVRKATTSTEIPTADENDIKITYSVAYETVNHYQTV